VFEPKITLHLLAAKGEKSNGNRFWIDWSDHWMGISKSKSIRGEEAQKIISLFERSLTNTEATHFCGHSPVYGVVAYREDGKKLKTSLCFSCVTWVKPKTRLDIKGKRGIDNVLCKALRAHIELPKSILEKAKREQDGADQPATAPESKPEGSQNPNPESEARSQ